MPDVTLRESLSLGAWGAVYGLALAGMGFLLAGCGEGAYFPILVFSSPLGLGGGCVMFLGPPIIWGAVGICLAEFKHRRARWLLLAIMGLHYFGVAWLCLGEWPFDYFVEKCRESLDVAILGFVIYGLGQLGIWVVFVLQCVHHRVQVTLRALLIATAILAIAMGSMAAVVCWAS